MFYRLDIYSYLFRLALSWHSWGGITCLALENAVSYYETRSCTSNLHPILLRPGTNRRRSSRLLGIW